MTPEDRDRLRKAFPASAIGKIPKAGVMLDYVGHAATTDRLLQVDPAWTWEPMAVDETGLPALDRKGNLWIRLTVCGVTRIGVGDGPSAKECIGDALRNAAMRFGVALDLWSKEELEGAHRPEQTQESEPPPPDEEEQPPKAPPLTSAQRRMFALLTQTGRKDKDAALAYIAGVIGREITSRTDMSEFQVEQVIAALKKETTEAKAQ